MHSSLPALIPAGMLYLIHRQRRFVRLICLLLVGSIAGCQSGDLVSAIGNDVPDGTRDKMREIAVAIQQAPVGQVQLIAALSEAATMPSNSFGGGDEIPTLTPEQARDLADFYANPESYLLDIYLNENKGAEKIDLLHAIYTKQDYSEIRIHLVEFLTADELAVLDEQVSDAQRLVYDIQSQENRLMPYSDTALHIMAGAAVALVVAGTVYRLIPWWRPAAKLAAVAAFGIVSGVFAGAAKELYDSLHPRNHTVDWRRDFLNTAAGSAASGVFIIATGKAAMALGISPVTTAVFWIVSGVVIGVPVLRNLIWGT